MLRILIKLKNNLYKGSVTMKKRILSMLLVVTMLVLTLAGCAYKYEKDDMSKYVSFNREAFAKALLELKVEDATFGHDEAARQGKVKDAIISSLASIAGTDKVTDKVIGANDLLYYCYYVTGTDETGDFVGAAASMKQSAAVKLQLGLSTTEGIGEKIEAAIAGYDFKDKAYDTSTSSSTEVKAGDLVYVTYSVVGADNKTTTYTNARLDLTGVEAVPEGGTATSLEQALIGKKVTVKTDEIKVGEVTYKNVTVNWTVKAGTALPEIDFKPTESTKVSVVGRTSTVDLSSDKVSNVKYHVYPVYFVDVVEYGSADYTATLILKEIIGDSLAAGEFEVKDEAGEVTTAATDGTLPIFKDNDFKAADGTAMHDVAKKLVELFDKLAEAEADYDEKETAFDDLDSDYKESDASEEEKQAYADAKKAKEDADTAKKNAEKAVDDQIAILVACKKGEVTAEDTIKTQYFDYRYDSLETSYKSSMKKNAAKAIYAAALECMEWKKDGDSLILPKKALKKAYNSIMDTYEYEYYEGTTSQKLENEDGTTTNASVPNYTLYESLEAFLRTKLGLAEDASKDDIKAAINKKAEAAVKDTVVVYLLKQEVEAIYDTDLEVTKDDIKAFEASINYILLQYYSGASEVKDEYYKPALQLDKVVNFLVEIDEEAVVADKSITFKNIKYTFK